MLRKITPVLALAITLFALIWAVFGLLQPSRYYPYVAIQHPASLNIKFIFHGHRDISDCHRVVNKIAKAMQQSCQECRILEQQCNETLTQEQRNYLFADVLDVPSSRLPQGMVVYGSDNPELTLSACRQSEIQTVGTTRRVMCYSPGTLRNSSSAVSKVLIDDLEKAAISVFIVVAGGLLVGWTGFAALRRSSKTFSVRQKPIIVKASLILSDCFVLLGVLLLQFHNGRYGYGISAQSVLAHLFLIALTLSWFWAGTEHYSYRRPAFNEIREIFKSIATLLILACAINFLIGEEIDRFDLLGTWCFYAFALPVSRWSTRIMLDYIDCWELETVIVGTGKAAYNLYGEIANDGALGFKVIGFVRLSDDQETDLCAIASTPPLPPCLPSIAIGENHPSVVALIPEDELANPMARQFVTKLYRDRHPPPLYHAWGAGPYVASAPHPPRNHVNRILKRAIDIFVASTLLVISAPILLTTMLMIWIIEGRPLFYVSRRYVSTSKSIAIPKFRSMVRDARSEKYRLKDRFMRDGYLDIPLSCEVYTPIGRVLERTQIVELPQLLCVLAGTMSLIGNRPLPHDNIVLLKKFADWEKRFDSPAGLSGISQVVGKLFLTPENRLNLEILYSEVYQHGSVFICDLAIIFYTARFIITGKPLSIEKATNILLSCMPTGFRQDNSSLSRTQT